jgi:photosystem II stability/assembly factor-like uncharacterized protein
MANRLARAAVLLCLTGLLHAGVLAHEAGVQNGVFRSRDGGATWLQVNPESFARGALVLAVHPSDPHRLLLATDSGLLSSSNGGRDWAPEAANVVTGPAFAVAYDLDGKEALASGANALYRWEDAQWHKARTPAGSAPARALVQGGVAGRAYLAGWTGLHRTDNWGRSWARVGQEIGSDPVSAAGRVWRSTDGARSWRVDDGAPQRVEALAFDRATPARLWIVAAGRAYRKNDVAARWGPVGAPIPDAQAKPCAIHVLKETMLVATDRGVFRSADAGASWALLSAELPEHSDATLMSDPHAPGTIYASFSRMSAEQLRGASTPPDAAIERADVALLVAAYAGFALLLLGVGLIVYRLTRAGTAVTADGSIPRRAESQS